VLTLKKINNRKILLSLAVLAIPHAFLSSNCNRICNCNDRGHTATLNTCTFTIDSIQTPHITNSKRLYKNYSGFRPGFIKKGDNYYFSYLSGSDLIFISIMDSSKIFRFHQFFVAGNGNTYLTHFSGDTIHVVDIQLKKYSQLKVSDDFRVIETNSVYLKNVIKSSKVYLYANIYGNQLAFKHPYLAIPYGVTNKKNLVDSTAILLFDVNTNKVKNIIKFPSCFKCKYFYTEYVQPQLYGENIYALFSFYNGFVSYNLTDESTKWKILPNSVGYNQFDKKKSQNLAYVRNYLSTTEQNVFGGAVSDNRYIIIKKRETDNIQNGPSYIIYSYKTDSITCINDLRKDLLPGMSFKFKNGIIIPNKNFSELFYYEFP
jgi:hypothetical protein